MVLTRPRLCPQDTTPQLKIYSVARSILFFSVALFQSINSESIFCAKSEAIAWLLPNWSAKSVLQKLFLLTTKILNPLE